MCVCVCVCVRCQSPFDSYTFEFYIWGVQGSGMSRVKLPKILQGVPQKMSFSVF